MKHILNFLLALLLLGCQVQDFRTAQGVSYFFDRQAKQWEECLPLGNGRIGMMADGGVDSERILLNEISMWSGSKQNADNPAAAYALPQIRRLLFEGRNDEAQGRGQQPGRRCGCALWQLSIVWLFELALHV